MKDKSTRPKNWKPERTLTQATNKRLPWYMSAGEVTPTKVEIKMHPVYIFWLRARIWWRPYRAKLRALAARYPLHTQPEPPKQ